MQLDSVVFPKRLRRENAEDIPNAEPLDEQHFPSTYDEATRATSSGYFGCLPKELRELIYTAVFISGSTSLTTTSRALGNDTKEALHKHGILCLTIDCEFHHCVVHPAYVYNSTIRSSQRQSRGHDV